MSTVNTYKRILRKLLPLGVLWSNINSIFDALLESVAAEGKRVHDSADTLILESNPGTSSLLLSDYEAMALATDEKPVGGETTSQRQQVVAAKMRTAYTGPSRAFFVALAAKLGMTVTVLDGSSVSAAVVARVEDALVDQDRVSDDRDVFTWEIHVVTDPNSQLAKLKAMVSRLKPAHTSVFYT